MGQGRDDPSPEEIDDIFGISVMMGIVASLLAIWICI